MRRITEDLKIFFSGKGKTKIGAILFFALGLLVIFWPAFTLETTYSPEYKGIFVSSVFILCMISLWISVYLLGIVHIVVWIWGGIAIVLHHTRTWIAIVYFVLMVISILWISVLWWTDDLSESFFKKR